MSNIPDCFYRISAKALVLNAEKKFLLLKEEDGHWEVPGGGVNFGETAQAAIRRELHEEAGLQTKFVANNPCYFLIFPNKQENCWKANIFYLTHIKDLDFTPSDECLEAKFFTRQEAMQTNPKSHVKQFIDLFDPRNHESS